MPVTGEFVRRRQRQGILSAGASIPRPPLLTSLSAGMPGAPNSRVGPPAGMAGPPAGLAEPPAGVAEPPAGVTNSTSQRNNTVATNILISDMATKRPGHMLVPPPKGIQATDGMTRRPCLRRTGGVLLLAGGKNRFHLKDAGSGYSSGSKCEKAGDSTT